MENIKQIKELLEKNDISFKVSKKSDEIVVETGVVHKIKIYDNMVEVCVRIKASDFEHSDETLPKIDREREMLDFIEAKIEDKFIDWEFERNMYSLSGPDEYDPNAIFEVYFQSEFSRGRFDVRKVRRALKYVTSKRLNRKKYSFYF